MSQQASDPKNIKTAVEFILESEREYVFQIPRSENVIFLMTGGIDSSIGAELCLLKWGVTLFPIYILRGATAQKQELAAVQSVLTYLKSKYGSRVRDLFTINSTVPPREVKGQLSRERVIKHGHPLRNSIMQSLAVQYGAMLNDKGTPVRTVLVASVASDFFPGSREVDLVINTLYTCSNMGEWDWQINSPMLTGNLLGKEKRLRKIDLIKWGIQNRFPFNITRTCTKHSDNVCGICEECKERRDTFAQAGITDPIAYS